MTPATYGCCKLDCECNEVKSTHDVCQNTGKCGELKLYFSLSAGGYTKKKEKEKRCQREHQQQQFVKMVATVHTHPKVLS